MWVARAISDKNGRDIYDTYATKNDFITNLSQNNLNENNKYFGNTWSYAGPDGVSIDAGTWLVSYYVWFSASSSIDFISIKSTVDSVVGVTSPTTTNGTFLEMHEIISGMAINNIRFFVYVPTPCTFGQVSSKIRAIKLR